MKTQSVISKKPPSDGKEWDCQCARCGSSVYWEECWQCGGDGCTAPGELYEEDPLWYDEEDFEECNNCNGEAAWPVCLSSPAWCESHPIQGRENIQRGMVEWFRP